MRPTEIDDAQVEVNNKVTELSSDNIDKKRRRIENLQKWVVSNRSDYGETASYMGVCRLPKVAGSEGTRAEHRHRRIDLKTYPRSYLPFALLYFTG